MDEVPLCPPSGAFHQDFETPTKAPQTRNLQRQPSHSAAQPPSPQRDPLATDALLSWVHSACYFTTGFCFNCKLLSMAQQAFFPRLCIQGLNPKKSTLCAKDVNLPSRCEMLSSQLSVKISVSFKRIFFFDPMVFLLKNGEINQPCTFSLRTPKRSDLREPNALTKRRPKTGKGGAPKPYSHGLELLQSDLLGVFLRRSKERGITEGEHQQNGNGPGSRKSRREPLSWP